MTGEERSKGLSDVGGGIEVQGRKPFGPQDVPIEEFRKLAFGLFWIQFRRQPEGRAPRLDPWPAPFL
jgi:hypothetical protein